MNISARVLPFVVTFLVAIGTATAQPEWLDTVKVPGYEYSDEFLFGANAIIWDTVGFEMLYNLGIDCTYTYGGPGKKALDQLRDPDYWTGSASTTVTSLNASG